MAERERARRDRRGRGGRLVAVLSQLIYYKREPLTRCEPPIAK
jgi:hypothetical protein